MGIDAVKFARDRREENIKAMKEMYQNIKEDDVLLAKFCLKRNTSMRTAKEYFKLLKIAGELDG